LIIYCNAYAPFCIIYYIVQCKGCMFVGEYKIHGGHRLSGEVVIHGSKNAALPILAATLLNGGKNLIHNCPELTDTENMAEILRYLGCSVMRDGKDVMIDSSNLNSKEIPGHMMCKTRSSTLFAGALAARRKRVFISDSGGCSIGARPIDIHLMAFEKMGMKISAIDGGILCSAGEMKACSVRLPFPSVGATENIMLASALTPGVTTIFNAACEPEICNLSDFLKSIGVGVAGAGTSVICISGASRPQNGEVTVIPDRIVAATYAVCAAITGGCVRVEGITPSHLSPVLAILRQMGCTISFGNDFFTVECRKRTENIPLIKTGPYPYFPTDSQPLLMSLMTVSKGVGAVSERIFERRFGHCERLRHMGADIKIIGNSACVRGVSRLKGCCVDACDLRCGAALVAAALAADGTTMISRTDYIERGYENLCTGLSGLGADIERIDYVVR